MEKIEYGWLLEKDGPLYLTIDVGMFEWTPDMNKALRLARRHDADMLCELIDDCWRIAEHQWG